MNLKLKAAAIVVAFLVLTASLGAGLQWLGTVFTTEQIMNAIAWTFIAGLLYGVYNLILTKLEYDARVDEIAARMKDKA